MHELAETVKEVKISELAFGLHRFPSLLNIIGSILQMINPDVEIIQVENTPDDPRQRKPDITKAKELLGWEPKVKLREGIPLMEDDFRTRLGIPRT